MLYLKVNLNKTMHILLFSILSDLMLEDEHSVSPGIKGVAREKFPRRPRKLRRHNHHHVATPFKIQILSQQLQDLVIRPNERNRHHLQTSPH